MALVANNPSAAKRLKVPQSIGEDFMKADMGKKFKEGGASMKSDLKQDKKVVKKAMSMHDKQAHGGKATDLTKLKKGGMPKGMDPSKAAPHHTPDFYLDDSMLDTGVKAFCNIVFDYATLKSAKK